jgi:acid phosphatase
MLNMTNSGWRLPALLLLSLASPGLMLLTGCGGSSGSSNSGSINGGGGNFSGGGGTNSGIPSVQHVVIVALENTNYSQVVGSPNAPYLNSLIAKGGLATNYYANVHPSIGNYFFMTTGQDVTNDDTFFGIVSVDNVVRELSAVSKTWKDYAEDLPKVGYIGPDIPPFYARRHNPLTYFSDVIQDPNALLRIVPYSQLAADLANDGLPNYSFIAPNTAHDGHSCSDGSMNCDISVRVANADTWMSNNLPAILNNSQFQQSELLIVTFDESSDDNTNGGGKVMTLLLGTKVKAGYTGTGQYDHRSLLGLSMTALGAKVPDAASGANQMTEFFH